MLLLQMDGKKGGGEGSGKGGSERQRGEGGAGREREKRRGKGRHVDEQISKAAKIRTVNEFASRPNFGGKERVFVSNQKLHLEKYCFQQKLGSGSDRQSSISSRDLLVLTVRKTAATFHSVEHYAPIIFFCCTCKNTMGNVFHLIDIMQFIHTIIEKVKQQQKKKPCIKNRLEGNTPKC